MALSIKDPETRRAIEERLRRLGGKSRKAALLEDTAEIRRRWSAMPVLDNRPADEIIGYDEHRLQH
jgi:antitoxin VapB